MKLLQPRKKIYEGESQMLISYHGIRFVLCEQQFDSEELLCGRNSDQSFIDLKALLPAFDFFQIVLASGFQPNDNPTFRNRLGWPDDDRKEPYYSADGLHLFYEMRLNLLCIFSHGEVSPKRFQFTCEGIWELYPIIAVSLFKDISGDLDAYQLKELINHQDFNHLVFEAIWNILNPQQQEQFSAFNNSPAARQYREERGALAHYVDFHHLPAQLDDETIRNILKFQADPAMRAMFTDLLSHAHKTQLAQYEWRLHEQEKAAREAAKTPEQRKQEQANREARLIDPTPRFHGNLGEPETLEQYIAKYGVDPRTGRKPDDVTGLTLQELHDRLLEKGCNRFYIEGIGGPESSDVDVLGFDGGWQVYYSERGQKSRPFFTAADRHAAMQFYYNHIVAMEHRHLVLATRSTEALEAIRDGLERAGIPTIQDELPGYAAPGDCVYRLFVTNRRIFGARNVLVAVPLQDVGRSENNQDQPAGLTS